MKVLKETLQKVHNRLSQHFVERSAELQEVNISLRREIAERIRIEEALQKSELALRAFLDASTEVILLVELNGNILEMNEAVVQTLEKTREELIGTNIFEIFDLKAFKRRKAQSRKVIRSGKSFRFEEQHEGKWFDINLQPVFDEHGVMIQIAIFANDITERKRTEETLLQLQKAVETMRLGVTITNIERKIIYSNPADARIHGYTVEELIDEDVNIFAPPSLKKPMTLSDVERMKGWVRESLNVRKNGTTFPVQLMSDCVKDPEGKTIAIVTTCEDITERKRAEESLRKAREELEIRVKERTAELSTTNVMLHQEIVERKHAQTELQKAKEIAEFASRAKSEFLANMSHELRTPLNAVLGYAQIFIEAENLSERQRNGMKTIKNSGEHLLTLINDILDLSKIEAGRMELHESELLLPEFLTRISQMIQIRAEQKNLPFVYESELDKGLWVQADEKRLRQVLLNLLGNAVKFTEKGRVTLKVCSNHFSDKERSDKSLTTNIRFEIEDTGIGIEQDKLEEIFLPFQQAGKKRYSIEGTGLGLSISRKLVTMMGGELNVESTVGQGSLFNFVLNFSIVEEQSQERPDTRKILGYKGKRRTVLIVDDMQENRAVLVNMLSNVGFEILEAENGQECLKKFFDYRPEVVLLDLQMPVMNGFETAKHIREFEKIHDTTIIAVSAHAFEESRSQTMEAGCSDFLVKPVQLEGLLELLRIYLQLEWVYKEHNQSKQNEALWGSIEPESAIDLPRKEVEILLKLARRGNIKKILACLADIEDLGKQYLPLIKILRLLAKNFQVDKIVDIMEAMEKHYE